MICLRRHYCWSRVWYSGRISLPMALLSRVLWAASSCSSIAFAVVTSQYDLGFSISDGDDCIWASLSYRRWHDLFDISDLRSGRTGFLSDFLSLVSGMADISILLVFVYLIVYVFNIFRWWGMILVSKTLWRM